MNTLHHMYIYLIQPSCFFADYNSHAVPYFVSFSFLPLDLLYFKSVAILMHDISSSLTPANVSNSFASQSNIYSYNTLSSSGGDYYVLLYRHECFTEKYTTRKIHKNYIRDPSGLFSIISHVSLSMT